MQYLQNYWQYKEYIKNKKIIQRVNTQTSSNKKFLKLNFFIFISSKAKLVNKKADNTKKKLTPKKNVDMLLIIFHQ